MASSVRVVPNKAGYMSVLGSSGVQGEVESMAEAIRDAATGMLDPDEGYREEDFEVKPFQGVITTGFVVRTNTDHARASQNKNNTLLKALGAGRR
jgi:hypothetical protein